MTDGLYSPLDATGAEMLDATRGGGYCVDNQPNTESLMRDLIKCCELK